MRGFSIRTLMAVIVVSAVGLAALRNANDWWAGLLLLLALVAFGSAVLGAIFLRGRDRAWWTGFALFCGGYLALTLVPGASKEIAPRLLTTKLLDYVRSQTGPADRVTLGRRLFLYQRMRRQLLDSEQENEDPNDPLLVAAKAKLTNEYRDIMKSASFSKSNLASAPTVLATNKSLPTAALWQSFLIKSAQFRSPA
jgi:hypothetical protein